ncbi:MAG: hypothetical protein WAN74_00695 [Thermoplasmata archaeon]
MSWLRRRKEEPTVNVTVNNSPAQEAAAVADPGPDETEQQGKAALIAASLKRIKEATSVKARLKKLFADFGWVTVLFFIIGLLVWPTGWEIVVGSFVVFNLGMYAYTKWVYKPPVVSVVLFNDDGTGGILNAWAIPVEIWDQVVKIGMSNTIRTGLGTTYMIRSITFADDSELVPIAIEFSWLHYNELNFATKREMFDELRQTLKIAWEQNNRYKWLMEVITLRRAVAMTKRWISLISHGRYAPLSAQDEAQLGREIEGLARETTKLRLPTLDERGQGYSSAEDEGIAPL